MNTASPRRALVVRCPTCSGDSRFDASNPWRPFCTERCKSIDLGAWATESYRVASPSESPESTEDPDPNAGPH